MRLDGASTAGLLSELFLFAAAMGLRQSLHPSRRPMAVLDGVHQSGCCADDVVCSSAAL